MITFHSRETFVANEIPMDSVMAEVGVYQGRHAKQMYELAEPRELWLIDRWAAFRHNREKQTQWSREITTGQMIDAMAKTAWEVGPDDPKVRMIRAESKVAAGLFRIRYFHYIYIDGSHDQESVQSDLQIWWPLVKDGWWIGGHDYDCKEFPGVTRAVDEFQRWHRDEIECFARTKDGPNVNDSFFIRKKTYARSDR